MLVVVADGTCDVEDAGCSNVAATNSILLSLLTDRLKNIHDIELPLCEHDTAHIVKQLSVRNSNDADYVLPPCLPTKFHCYIRMLSSSHLVLTVVPATYDDMVAVVSMLDSLASAGSSATDDVTRLNRDKNVEAVAETVNGGGIPADEEMDISKNVDETSHDLNNGRYQANAEVDTSPPSVDAAHSETATSNCTPNIRLPVFVFDCLLKLVSDQLVHHSVSNRPPDIIEDFTYPVPAALSF